LEALALEQRVLKIRKSKTYILGQFILAFNLFLIN